MASGLVLRRFPRPRVSCRGAEHGAERARGQRAGPEGRGQAAGPQSSDAERLAPAPTVAEPRSWRVDMLGVDRILSLLLVSLLPGTARSFRVSPQRPHAGMH